MLSWDSRTFVLWIEEEVSLRLGFFQGFFHTEQQRKRPELSWGHLLEIEFWGLSGLGCLSLSIS